MSELPLLSSENQFSSDIMLEQRDDGEIGDEEADADSNHLTESALTQRYRKIFGEWKRVRARSIAIEEINKSIVDSGRSYEPSISTRALLVKESASRIVHTPRDYQVEMYQRAKTQNTIAVLDTGSGKTLIAVLLLRHVLDQELEDRAGGRAPRISFFLVDKVSLVYQQTSVLQTNLDQNITGFSGQGGGDLTSRNFWRENFRNNMVIVCTADIFEQCLMRAFILMEEVNLLILDEAHHAKKNHTYARIMRNHYADIEDRSKRPRIFGMTASPVDVGPNEDIHEKTRNLETLLHSKIATTPSLSVVQNPDLESPNHDSVIEFDVFEKPPESELLQQLSHIFGASSKLAAWAETAKYLNASLGHWPANSYICTVFSEKGIRKAAEKITRKFYLKKRASAAFNLAEMEAKMEAEKALLTSANEIVREYALESPGICLPDLSQKVLSLFSLLGRVYRTPTEAKCIVFVERKATALVLHQLSENIGGPYLKSGYLVGTNDGEVTVTFKEQGSTMLDFRKDKLNCLFATSVAEEGLDIKECNLVVRFDPCKTMIQYVQSRGRARAKDSKIVHLVERGNWLDINNLNNVRAGVVQMKKFCENLSMDRKLLVDVEEDQDEGGVLLRDSNCRWFKVGETGAVLSYDNSLVILNHFAGCLPPIDDEGWTAELNYSITPLDGGFQCEVVLPFNSPLQRAIGLVLPRKSLAKQSAAFEACLNLRRMQYLDENLLPTYQKKVPELRYKALAITAQSLKAYPMKLKPEHWSIGMGTISTRLYLTVICLQDDWDRPVSPIGLLTREPMPSLPSFSIFRLDGTHCMVLLKSYTKEIHLDGLYKNQLHQSAIGTQTTTGATKLDAVTGFTLRIFQDLFNKKFEFDPKAMPYWLVPLTHDSVTSYSQESSCGHELIDWNVVFAVHDRDPFQWTPDLPTEIFEERFVIDPGSGARRFFTKQVAGGHKADDPIPETAASLTLSKKRANTIAEFSTSIRRRAQETKGWDPDQPVFFAEQTSHRLNVLAAVQEQEQKFNGSCLICLEPLLVSQIPSRVAAMAYLFPATIHRIESYLIALEFTQSQLGLDIPPALALEAITKDTEDTEDVQEQHFTSQRGMGPTYEKLEFIGDCFLKLAVSISLFARKVGKNEEEMHLHRMISICNKNLFNVAKKKECYRYIRATAFSRRLWYPLTLKLLQGKVVGIKEPGTTATQILGEKTIADVSEAMIGAALMSNFVSGDSDSGQFDNAVKAVTVFVDNESHAEIRKWADYWALYNHPQYFLQTPRAYEQDLAEKLERKCGYHFKNPRILACAFNDPSNSMSETGLPSYQRLEFLGDSLHDMVCVMHLVQRHAQRDPQWLTEHKMAMVSNQFLGVLSVTLGFHKHLRHRNSSLRNAIEVYVNEVQQAGVDSAGSRTYWMDIRDPPKCLADVVEAYIGAVFVDSNFDYARVQQFFDGFVRVFFEDMHLYDTFVSNQATTRLGQILRRFGCQESRILTDEIDLADAKTKRSVAVLIVHGRVVAEGMAKSVKYAREKVGQHALAKLEHLSIKDFQELYGCGCGSLSGSETNVAVGEIDNLQISSDHVD